MASMGQAVTQIREMYTQLSLGKKISFALIFVVLLSTFVGLVWWAGRPEYRILYTDLSAEDASSVVTHLKDNKIQYQLLRGGTAVSVPVDDYYEVRMSLANAGLPTGGSVGFELFDRKSLGMTDFQMRVAYLRALQGELSRTIQQIAAVDGCRVHLVIPEETLFIADQRDATASIVIKQAANARLNDEQVSGIVYLVSSSVEGLDPHNVTVIDHKGRVLSKRTDEASGGDIADKAHKTASALEQRIVSLLARSVGPEKVAAKVSVDLDTQQTQRVIEDYNPDRQVVRSEQIVTSTNEGTESSSSAFPGVEANLPENAYQEGTKQQTKGEKRQETINYEISRTTSTTTQPGGSIRKLSIAVLIDGTYEEVKDDEGNVTRNYVPRTDDEMGTFTEIVKKAVGFDKERGDQIEVANIAFLTEGVGDEEWGGGDRTGFYLQILNYALAILGVLLFLLFVVRPMIRWLTAEPSLESELGIPAGMLQGATVGELEASLGGGMLPGAPEAEVKAEGERLEDRMKKLEMQKADLLETASRDRNAVTIMVRRWLKEEEGGASNA